MNKIKKGDVVIVIAGKDKGKKGAVLLVRKDDKLVVEGVNLAKKHVEANPNANEQGGIVEKPMPIQRSNVMIYDASQQKGVRIGIKKLTDGQLVRFYKGSDQLVDVKS